MPTSHSNQLNEIVQIAELLKPMGVLDIGIGNGKYGFLLREYLGHNRGLGKNNFVIDGVEGYEDYITNIHREIYNEIHVLNLCDKNKFPNKQYDLCLLVDILEHFKKDKGIEIIEFFSSISKFLLIATPWNVGDLSIKHNNPLEDHVYQWKKKDFHQFEHHCFIHNSDSLVVLLGQDKNQIDFVQKKMQHRFYKNIYDYLRRLLGVKQS